MHRLLLSLLVLSVSQVVSAELLVPELSQAQFSEQSTDVTLAKAGLEENNDDITKEQDINQLELNKEQLHEAQVWGLTEFEEKRYVFLMQNQSKTFYEGLRLTPIDILGINARTDEERNHFAKIAADIEAQKVAKNIAWNNAFHRAYLERVNGIPVVRKFDTSPYSPAAYKPVVLSAGDRLHFFISRKDSVSTIVISLIKAIEQTPNTLWHITLIDGDEQDIQLWANAHNLPHQRVEEGRIVLDIGRQAFDGLNLEKTPMLLLSKNNESRIVDLGRF